MFHIQVADPRETYISNHVAIFSMTSHFLRTNKKYKLNFIQSRDYRYWTDTEKR